MLELKQGIMPIVFAGKYHLYDEIAPVNPLIVSNKNKETKTVGRTPTLSNAIFNHTLSRVIHVLPLYGAGIRVAY